MRILFSVTYFSPYVSGLTVYVERLAGEMAKLKYRVKVLCMQHENQLPATQAAGGVGIVRAKPLLRFSKGFISLDWLVKSWQLVSEADVIIVNLPQFEGVVPAVVAKFTGKRVVAVYHCEVVLPRGLLNQIVQAFLEISNSLSLWLSDVIVTYTKDFALHARLLKPFLSKVIPVYPPVPPPEVDEKTKQRLYQRIGNTNIRIGLAARLAAEKGIEYVFAAIGELKLKLKTDKFKIVIAGPLDPVGEETYKQKILSLEEKYAKHIVLLGPLTQQQIGAFYSLLDVLVLPSVNSTEAFGMVQVEAMLCGIAVVATNLPGVRIPIKRTGAGIVVPTKNATAIAEAIATVVYNQKHYKDSTRAASGEFAITKTIRAYRKLLLFKTRLRRTTGLLYQ